MSLYERVSTMNFNVCSRLCAFFLALAGCGGDLDLPPLVASSKYVDYGTWTDTTAVCMDDKLAVWDRYIEQTSAFLGIDPPTRRIRYSWVPESEQHDVTWPCSPSGVGGCAYPADSEYQSFVFAGRAEMLHEFVHAVEIPAFGRAHKVFSEGMAEYLSEGDPPWGVKIDFPTQFVDMVERDRLIDDDYRVAMHFVGSLLERDGSEEYLVYRALVPRDGKFAEFAAAYAQVYGEDLFEALAAMGEPIEGQGPWLCDGSVGPRIEIDGSGAPLLLAGECGDGDFFNPGADEGERSASKVFMLDVAVSGKYEMTLRGAGAPAMPYSFVITNCPGTNQGTTTGSAERPSIATLWAGSHRLQVWYPGGLEGAATLDVRLLAPLP